MLKKFKRRFKPTGQRIKVSDELLNEYKHKVPLLLRRLWLAHGFGKYNNGLIEIINPKEFEHYLWSWLGEENKDFIPIAMTGFGELFYYRKLNHLEEDICIIDIHYKESAPVEFSLEAFFESFLTDVRVRESWLNEGLFKQGISILGELADNEIFMNSKSIVADKSPSLEKLKKGDSKAYQEFLLE